jgi:hypothetical protein
VVLLLCDEISCLLCRQMAAMKEPHSKVMHADSFFTTTTLPSNSKTPLQHPPSHGAGAARRDDTLQLAHGMVSARRRYQHQPAVIR